AALALGLPLMLGLLVAPVLQNPLKAAERLLPSGNAQLSPPARYEPLHATLPAGRLAAIDTASGKSRPSGPAPNHGAGQSDSGTLGKDAASPARGASAAAPTVAQPPAAKDAPATASEDSAQPQPEAQKLPDLPATTGLLPTIVPGVDGWSNSLVVHDRD